MEGHGPQIHETTVRGVRMLVWRWQGHEMAVRVGDDRDAAHSHLHGAATAAMQAHAVGQPTPAHMRGDRHAKRVVNKLSDALVEAKLAQAMEGPVGEV